LVGAQKQGLDTEIPLSPQWLMKLGENKVCSRGENHTMNIIHGDCSNRVLVRLY
jgi:hypothetical protein